MMHLKIVVTHLQRNKYWTIFVSLHNFVKDNKTVLLQKDVMVITGTSK